MWFVPVVSARLSTNVPSAAAVPVIEALLSLLCAMSVDRPWTLPLMSTFLPFTFAPFLGDVTVIFGLPVSST